MCNNNIEDLNKDDEVELVGHINKSYRKLLTNWIIIDGDGGDLLQESKIKFINSVKKFCDALVEESEENKTDLMSNIEQVYKEYYNLSKELYGSGHQDMAMESKSNDPLNKIYMCLKNKLGELHKEASNRIETYKKLYKKQQDFCQILNKEARHLNESVPSVDCIEDLRSYIRELEAQHAEFEKMMESIRRKIVDILKRLELQPSCQLEMYCVGPTEDSDLPRNVHTLKKMEETLKDLNEQEQQLKTEADRLRNDVTILWDRLNEPYENRERVILETQGYTYNKIKILKDELQRCEELKQKNMKIFIDKVKEELFDWWSMCQLSQEEKDRFNLYKEELCNDDVLNLLEMEVDRMRSFYLKYEDIYKLIDQRKELWDKLLALDAASKDSARLLSRGANRGGALLREQQERNRVQKNLPRVEEKLKKKLKQFELEEKRKFTVFGQSVEEMIESQYNEFHQKKDPPKKMQTLRTPLTANRKHVHNKYGVSSSASSSRKDIPSAVAASHLPESSYSSFQEELEERNQQSVQKAMCNTQLSPNVLRPILPHNGQILPIHSSPKSSPKKAIRPPLYSKNTPHSSRPPFKYCGGSSSNIPTFVFPTSNTNSPKPKTPTTRRKLPIIL